MAKQHLCMLAHPFKPKKHGIGGWYASEKLDGHRAIWIPGTRGLLKSEVPFANTDKDSRYKEVQVCSGLWSRYGNVIHAPDEWLNTLPITFLDGELYMGRDNRQALSSTIKRLTPDIDQWQEVQFMCFDMPSPEALFADREIKLTNYHKDMQGILAWWEGLNVNLMYRPKPTTHFQSTVKLLEKHLSISYYAHAHKQTPLKFQTSLAMSQIDIMVDRISGQKGEGLILRNPSSRWLTERSHSLLKIKKLRDDEGTVTGYVTGRKTDKGSKLLGLMGALVLDYNGKRFELSGFTDRERMFNGSEAFQWACRHPGEDVPEWVEALAFPRGTKVTFQYRDLTNDGIPNEGRFWRKECNL